MTIRRMEHVGIVVEDLAAATAFFVELGLELKGEGPVAGGWVDRVIGLEGVRAEVAMVETADGHGRLELTKFHAPSGRPGDQHVPANALGIRHVAFEVDDIDAVVAGVRAHGAELVGEMERYEDRYRLCYVRGPEGIIVELAQQIRPRAPSTGTLPAITDVERAVRDGWGRDTSDDPGGWSEENRAFGQCAVSALVVRAIYGGELVIATVLDRDGEPTPDGHAWNVLPTGEAVDFTFGQFRDGEQLGPPIITEPVIDGDPRRGHLLADRVSRALGVRIELPDLGE